MAAPPTTGLRSHSPDSPDTPGCPESGKGSTPTRRLLLFTKPGVPGRVKTRLTTELTPEQAAVVHQAFVDDLVERLGEGAFELRIAWALEPGEALPAVTSESPGSGPQASPSSADTRDSATAAVFPQTAISPEAAALPALRQEGADLGERLFRGLRAAATVDGGAATVAALGSDHPTADLDVLGEAFERVEAGADVVLGPSHDGGYYLIVVAARALTPALFADVDWSTERVLRQTVERIETAGLRLEWVPAALDVDTPEDLRRLMDELAVADPALCPRTRRVLADLGLLDRSGRDSRDGAADERGRNES